MKNLFLFVLSVLAMATAHAEMMPFEPAQSVDDPSAQMYYIYQPNHQLYVKVTNGNILGNNFTGDKFIFVETGQEDCYYVYNQSCDQYVYYTATTASSNVKETSGSVVKLTSNKETANAWRFVKDGSNWDIVPATATVTTNTQGWNFRGGKDYALNLYDRSDVNGNWQIVGQLPVVTRFANKVYSLPGKPFMHKLLPAEGNDVVDVAGLPEGLSLMTDRAKYKYVYGKAPEQAGEYPYTVMLADGSKVDVAFTVSEELAQPTPFMGILTWNAFKNYIDQDVIIKLADALGDFGLKELGYDHMCIDDCWATKNRVNGHLNIDTSKFPDMGKLVSEMHERGLKIGIYSDAGEYTCSQAQPGSYGFEKVDAKDFVDWGFDLLKYDYCFATGGTTAAAAEQAYTAMGRALDEAMTAAGKKPHDFKFYMCEWGWRQPYMWAANTGATCWRATDDTRDFWSDTIYKGGVKQVIDIFKNCWAYQGVNRWNDADMLCVGLHGTGYPSNDGGGDGYSAGMTQDEYRTNFGLWCMFSSPLTLSNNITNLDGKPNTLTRKTVTNTYYEEDLAIIRNSELIALDQDAMGQGAEPIYDTEDYIVFQKDLANGDVALSVTNMSRQSRTITVDFAELSALKTGVEYKLRDLWKHSYIDSEDGQHTLFTRQSQLVLTVPSHATFIYRIAPAASEDIVWVDPSYDPLREELKSLIATIEEVYTANDEGTEVSAVNLITKNSQFSSPFTESSEGSINNLLDGRADTFWHSQWKGVSSTEMDKHYLQVQLAEPIDGVLRCTTVRRSNAEADFVTRCRVDASTDDSQYATIGSVTFPFTSATAAKGETVSGDFCVPTPAKYFRFYISETQGAAGNRTYGHFAEFQLNQLTKLSPNQQHPEAAAALQDALLEVQGNFHPSQADIDALSEAYASYLAAISETANSLPHISTSQNSTPYDLQGRSYVRLPNSGLYIVNGRKVITTAGKER